MKLYHFTKKDHAMSDISNSWLKIATIEQLNDPFEFYTNITQKGLDVDESSLQKIRNKFQDNLGILSFSRYSNSPVQWAHYAEEHKGVCLEFEVPSKIPVEIKYMDTPLNIELDDANWEATYVDSTKAKYEHWSYEDESRIIVNLKSKDVVKKRGLYFSRFSGDLELKSIVLGVHCHITRRERDRILEKGIVIHQAKLSRSEFAIEY